MKINPIDIQLVTRKIIVMKIFVLKIWCFLEEIQRFSHYNGNIILLSYTKLKYGEYGKSMVFFKMTKNIYHSILTNQRGQYNGNRITEK